MKRLSESSLIFEMEQAISLVGLMNKELLPGVREVVGLSSELVVFYQPDLVTPSEIHHWVTNHKDTTTIQPKEWKIPICYELGEDWIDVASHTGMEKEHIISIHLAGSYEAAFGFMPGFVYLSGLPEAIHCPRRTTPRTRVPKGAVGIGGENTGIYGLSTPGGWQLIGCTPFEMIDENGIQSGDRIRFDRITIDEFHSYGQH